MPDLNSSLPKNGRVSCARCFPGPTVWNETELRVDNWHVVNNPMSWGTATPKFMLLGVSKGTTQCDAIAAKPHDDVPFDGFRAAITKALQMLGLLQSTESIGGKISAAEEDWAFGSMVRCALGLQKVDGTTERSGSVVSRLAAMPIEHSWIALCSSVFLRALPSSLRVVVLLSNDDRYVEACFLAVRRLRAGTRRINSVSYGDEQITWVHIIHVGGPGKNHITAWFAGESTQGNKRRDAQAAVRRALGEAVDHGKMPLLFSSAQTQARVSRPKTSPKSAGQRRPVPPNPVRDAVLASVKVHTFFVQHPAEKEPFGTKYVSAFRGKNGRAIAFDKAAASKQPLWLRDEPRARALLESLHIEFDAYPAESGRNSNLKKLPEFERQALLRAFPQTEREAMAIVEGVARFA